ncbi:MAG: glycosyltransferase family 4 protein [Gammaproteobacteria bacterium]
MRILHIDPDDMDNPVSGGGPIRTYEICRRLVARGHDVTVLTPTFPGSTPEKIRDGIRYVRLGRRIGDHGSSHHITFFLQAPRMLSKFPHDLLVEDFMPPMGPTFTPWFSKKPTIASIQWFFAEAWQRQFKLPFVSGQKLLLGNYRNFVVMTDKMKQHIAGRVPGARIQTIANAVPEHYFAGVPEYQDFILYVGRVDPRDKGVDLLLEAYARIPAFQRLPLKIVGHGWEFGAFNAQATRLGIAESVEFTGKKSPEEVRELFRTCRFAVTPSRMETFGMVILEAQAAAKPVVIFDLAPMNEVANPAGCERTPPFDVESYAQSMLKLINMPVTKLQRLGRANREFARHFSWDASAESQERFYRQVLEAETGRVS